MVIKTKQENKNMITFQCDHCKQAISTNENLFLTIKRGSDGNLWDICKGCANKLKEILGEGRVIAIPAYSPVRR